MKNAITTLQGYRKNVNLGVSLLLDRFAVVDVAFKVVGVGSVGTVCGIILLMSGKGDPLFLQFKQARQSVLEPYCGASPWEHAGQRVVIGMFHGLAPGSNTDWRACLNCRTTDRPFFGH